VSCIEPYPLLMAPAIQARPWGGSRIRDLLGKEIPPGIDGAAVGESWEVSAHPNGLSRVANGPLSGRFLPELHALWGDLLTGRAGATLPGSAFPLLVKLIEANTLASVQVHPNDEQARTLEGYPNGKSEAWYVIDSGPRAEAYIGFREGVDRTSFLDALRRGEVAQTLAPVHLRAGDCVLLDPGTVHACGNGILLLEVQQSCDLTYRVHDWDRVGGEGQGRELHVEKALEVIDFDSRPRVHRASGGENAPLPVLRGAHFSIFELRLRSSCALPPSEAFSTLTVIHGECSLASGAVSLRLRGGETVLLPAGVGCLLQGRDALLVGSSPAP
jgi:mannose-6-phosphate isomerase